MTGTAKSKNLSHTLTIQVENLARHSGPDFPFTLSYNTKPDMYTFPLI